MGHKILLDPEVILNPVSFAFHLAVFTERGKPMAVPLGWLWEEINKRYSLLTVADVMAYHSRVGKESLNESIYPDSYSLLNASIALLAVASRRGLIRPVATEDVGRFLRQADWASYLVDLVGHWDEVKPSRFVYEKAEDIAASEVAGKFGIKSDEVLDIYERNHEWLKRTAEEYPIYEHFRILSIKLSQLYAFLAAGYYLSTPSDYVRRLVTNVLGYNGLVTSIGSREPLLPILRKVAFNPRLFTVGNILSMVEGRQLLKKLGGVDIILEELRKSEDQKDFAKNLSLYIMGLVPALGTITSILGALDLLRGANELLSQAEVGESVLYYDVTDIQIEGPQT